MPSKDLMTGLLIATLTVVMSHNGVDAQSAIDRGSAPINACGFLNADEVSAVIGVPVDAGVRHDEGYVDGKGGTVDSTYSSTCLWRVSADRGANNPEAPLGGARFVILNVLTWPTDEAAGGFLQSFRDAAANHVIGMTPVPLALGDESLWWGDGVAVRKGHVSFGVSVRLTGLKVEERKQQEQLAGRVVARL